MTDTARPLRADAARNRARILEAASELFAARGLQVTLDDIARHAGLGTGTVYRRFPDRDALVEALFEARLDESAAVAAECLTDPDPWNGFVTMLRLTCASMARDRGLRQVMLSTAYGHTLVDTARARVVPLMQELIERAQAAGQLRPEFASGDVPLIFTMIGAVDDFAGHEPPDLWERYFALLVDGLRIPAVPGPPLRPALDDEAVGHAMSRWRPGSR